MKGSPEILWTDRQTDRQTDTQKTVISQDPPFYGGPKIGKKLSVLARLLNFMANQLKGNCNDTKPCLVTDHLLGCFVGETYRIK